METEKKVIFETLSKIIKKIINDETISIELDTPVEEIGFNSIDFIKLIVLIEDEYDVEIDDDYLNLENYKTLDDLVSIISELLS